MKLTNGKNYRCTFLFRNGSVSWSLLFRGAKKWLENVGCTNVLKNWEKVTPFERARKRKKIAWFVCVVLQRLDSPKEKKYIFSAFFSSSLSLCAPYNIHYWHRCSCCCCCCLLLFVCPCFLAKSISSPLHHLSFRCSRRYFFFSSRFFSCLPPPPPSSLFLSHHFISFALFFMDFDMVNERCMYSVWVCVSLKSLKTASECMISGQHPFAFTRWKVLAVFYFLILPRIVLEPSS